MLPTGGTGPWGPTIAWKSSGAALPPRTRTWPNSHKGHATSPRFPRALPRSPLAPHRLPRVPGAASDQNTRVLHPQAHSKALWVKAVKLPMYWVAVVPVLVGAGLVLFEGVGFAPARLAGLMLSSVLHLAWLNLSNDVFDSRTGVDLLKKESVVNLTGRPRLVLWVSAILLACSVGVFTTLQQQHANGIASAVMFALCIACGYVYQGPPFRLGYKGLGEPLCFLAFGPFATLANYLAMNPCEVSLAGLSPAVWGCASSVGLTSALVLFCSHFHQYEGDKAAGKMSPVVRLGGIKPAVKVLQWVSYGPYLWVGIMTLFGFLPLVSLISTTALSISKAADLNSAAKTSFLTEMWENRI